MTSEVAFSPNDDYIGELHVFLYTIVHTVLKLIDNVILTNPYLYMQQCLVTPSLRLLSISLSAQLLYPHTILYTG